MENDTLVLIVDDEPNVRLVFRTALESSGFAVAEAEDGESALERLQREPIALVLLDLKMPGVGGLETLRRLRDAGSDVPVVIVTAHGSIPDAVEAIKLGAIDFLSKPLRPDTLRQVVGDVVRRHAATDEPFEPARATAVVIATPALDLSTAKRALNRREFDRALELLEEALELDPASAEAYTLMGVLRESLGQTHGAYHAYKLALTIDPRYRPALDNLRCYCERQGLDFDNPAINPAAQGTRT